MSADRPAVSVVVPSYRAGPYLGELCDSLARQTFADFEVLILSDGCDDHRQPGVQAHAGDPRFRIAAWTPNRGVSQATAHLLRQVRGIYWCYPGADDLLDATFLERRVAVMTGDAAVDVVFGQGRQIDEHGEPFVYGPARDIAERLAAWNGQRIDPARMLRVLLQENVVNTPSVFCRSERTIPLIVEAAISWRYAQDQYYWMLLAAAGRVFRYEHEVLHSYRMHPAQLSAATEFTAVRLAEARLIPLIALAESAKLTPAAGQCWREWRSDLYALWILRAARLLRRGCLRRDWLVRGARAYHGGNYGTARAGLDLGLRLPRALRLHRAEKRRAARQLFVNGLRRIDDPLFRLSDER